MLSAELFRTATNKTPIEMIAETSETDLRHSKKKMFEP